MKWVYVSIGILLFYYIGQTIEYMVVGYANQGVVHVLKAGARP